MKKQQFKRWQVILGFIGFLAIYGLVGTLERQGEVTELRNQEYVVEMILEKEVQK